MSFFEYVDESIKNSKMSVLARITPTVFLILLIILTTGTNSIIYKSFELKYLNILASSMLLSYILHKIYCIYYKGINPYLAPLHLCELGFLIGPFFIFFQLDYLVAAWMPWAILGSLNAMLTPNISVNPNKFRYWTYYISHCILAYLPAYHLLELNIYPTYEIALYSFVIVVPLALLIGIYNSVFKTDFMFIAYNHDPRPEQKTLLSLLGPAPYYILSLIVLTSIIYWSFVTGINYLM